MRRKDSCRICDNVRLEEILSLGEMPLANAFVKDPAGVEEKYPLAVCFCPDCGLLQLKHVVDPQVMFRTYLYATSVSDTFRAHFTRMADDLIALLHLDENSLVADIGSNDGLLLSCFQQLGSRVVGIEPATNLAALAERRGIPTVNDFFGENAVSEIITKFGRPDLVTATNVFAHVDDVRAFVRNVLALLKDGGVFVIEVPYLLDMLKKMTFDMIYHEHLSYFAVRPLLKLFSQAAMEIFRIERSDVHGGSLRVFVQRKGGCFPTDESVPALLALEDEERIDQLQTYSEFASKVHDVRRELVACVATLKGNGHSIAAYGASAKGNTLLNFCSLGAERIDYVVDDSPLKQGLYTPGTRIPVVSQQELDSRRADYVLILAWNLAAEIMQKAAKYRAAGTKFIIPVPKPVIVP